MVAVRDELCGRAVGEFVLRERIGEGGFGAIYRCEQPLLGRQAVVKVLHGRLRASEHVIQRFLREARLASRLDHPYAAHVYAFGVEKQDGLLWIAMELVHGTPLDRWLRERGPMPLQQLVPFFERLAEVVHTAHEAGMVHRDLKPSNVMVMERAGRLLPKLLDWGIAKKLEEAPAPPEGRGHVSSDRSGGAADAPVAHVTMTLPARTMTDDEASGDGIPVAGVTATGTILGSPPYMAPEQFSASPDVGPSADLYALGILCFQTLTGRPPFTATSVASYAAMHAVAPVPELDPAHPAALNDFFASALAKEPRDRPASAVEMAAALRLAAGMAERDPRIPRLQEAARRQWLAEAPQPLAEGVAALDGAHNLHQARQAAHDLVRNLVRYLTGLALASRTQVQGSGDAPATLEQLRSFGREELDLTARVRLLSDLVRPLATTRMAHPIPELIDLGTRAHDHPVDRVVDLCTTAESATDEDRVRSHLAQLLPALSQLLHATSFLLDYQLVVMRDGVLENWSGLRRAQRPLADVFGGSPPDRQPVVIDFEGCVVLMLWPVAQVHAPSAGAPDELFLVDGRGRKGMRMVAAPGGYERHDVEVLDWLGATVIGDAGTHEADDRCPYLGLDPFSSADAHRFVGRERETDALINRLRQRPLQLVVGPSGAGKSSFVHAGVVPAMPAGWRVVSMRPGASPFTSLARCLAAIDVELDGTEPRGTAKLIASAGRAGVIVLVIDQLEELFTQCPDDEERLQFASLIAELSASPEAPTKVVATIRDDYLMRVEALPRLRPRVGPALFLLGNPPREDLVRTVIEPARRAGYEMSDRDLARDMADAVADRPGALALLSFTAARLWDLRDRRLRQLTRKAYDALGGVSGALGQHAEEVLAAMPADDRRLSREAFRRLVARDGTRVAIAPEELRQALASERCTVVLDQLIRARLLVAREADDSEGGNVEIAHEALVSAWPRLASWLREDSDRAACTTTCDPPPGSGQNAGVHPACSGAAKCSPTWSAGNARDWASPTPRQRLPRPARAKPLAGAAGAEWRSVLPWSYSPWPSRCFCG
jgi:serine/threonine protein kinase